MSEQKVIQVNWPDQTTFLSHVKEPELQELRESQEALKVAAEECTTVRNAIKETKGKLQGVTTRISRERGSLAKVALGRANLPQATQQATQQTSTQSFSDQRLWLDTITDLELTLEEAEADMVVARGRYRKAYNNCLKTGLEHHMATAEELLMRAYSHLCLAQGADMAHPANLVDVTFWNRIEVAAQVSDKQVMAQKLTGKSGPALFSMANVANPKLYTENLEQVQGEFTELLGELPR